MALGSTSTRRSRGRPPVRCMGVDDAGVCHMGFVTIPTATSSSFTAVYAPRVSALTVRPTARCRFRTRRRSTGASRTSRTSTPTPSDTVRDSPWHEVPPETMLELDVAGSRHDHRGRRRDRAGARGNHLCAADRGARAALLARRLGREVRRAQRGGLGARPARRRPEGRRAREAALRARRRTRPTGGSLFWRLLVVAEEELASRSSRRSPRPTPDLHSYTQHGAGVLPRAGLEVRVRLDPEPLTGDLALRHAPRAGRARRRARLGRRRLRLEEGQGPDPERPRRRRRDLARHRRVLHRRRPASRLRHVPGAHRAEHDVRLRLQGRAPRHVHRGVARDDPRREGRAEDERVPGEPQPACSRRRRTPISIPGLEILANDVRCTHGATVSRVDREQLFYADGPRALARRGRAADRARLLPGHPGPHRVRGRSRSRSPRPSKPASLRGYSFPPPRGAYSRRGSRPALRGGSSCSRRSLVQSAGAVVRATSACWWSWPPPGRSPTRSRTSSARPDWRRNYFDTASFGKVQAADRRDAVARGVQRQSRLRRHDEPQPRSASSPPRRSPPDRAGIDPAHYDDVIYAIADSHCGFHGATLGSRGDADPAAERSSSSSTSSATPSGSVMRKRRTASPSQACAASTRRETRSSPMGSGDLDFSAYEKVTPRVDPRPAARDGGEALRASRRRRRSRRSPRALIVDTEQGSWWIEYRVPAVPRAALPVHRQSRGPRRPFAANRRF